MQALKAVLFLLVAVVGIGFVTMIYSAVAGSSAWDLVPDGIGKSFAIVIPLVLLFGVLIITIYKVAHGKKEEM